MSQFSRPVGADRRICIMGMGYVGLTLAAVMADRGFEVAGIEIREDVLEDLEKGKAHFYERNLELLLRRGLSTGKLRFSRTIPTEAQYDVYVVTVGTPLDGEGRPRMEMVENVSRDIAGHMKDGALVVLRSTLRLGTSKNVVKPILDASGHPVRPRLLSGENHRGLRPHRALRAPAGRGRPHARSGGAGDEALSRADSDGHRGLFPGDG